MQYKEKHKEDRKESKCKQFRHPKRHRISRIVDTFFIIRIYLNPKAKLVFPHAISHVQI